MTYTYDAENRLISVSGNGHTAQFACVRRTLDGVTSVFTYDQWTPIVEWDGSGNLVATNVYGIGMDEVLYRSSGSTQLFYKSDPMGNVRFLLTNTGAAVEKYTYDAFGAPKITDMSGNARAASAYGNRFMFSGREYLQSLGLYDLRNRLYDPVTGSFLQTDPIGFEGDPLNLYRFSGNNPLLGGDPTGLGFWDDIGDFFGDLGSAFSGTFNYVISNSNFGYGSSGWPSGSSDAAIFASANWWGDSGNYSTIPWGGIYGFGSSNTFGSGSFGLGFIGKGSDWKPQGQFTIGYKPISTTNTGVGASGSIIDIEFVCPTCTQYQSYRLLQDWRGLVGIRNGKYQISDKFIPDKPFLNQEQVPNGVSARDEAGQWDPRGHKPGSMIPGQTAMTRFEPFYQEMVTAAYGKAKDTGNEILMGVVRWRVDYAPDRLPRYTGFGTHAAVAPDPGSRFHQ